MPDLPKTPEEATVLLREWHEKRCLPDHPTDLSDQFHHATCLARCFIDRVHGCVPDVDDGEAMECAAEQMAEASEKLEQEMARWGIYDTAVGLIGGRDKVYQLLYGPRKDGTTQVGPGKVA